MKITIDSKDTCTKQYFEKVLIPGTMFLYGGNLFLLTSIIQHMSNTVVLRAINISAGSWEDEKYQISYGLIKIVTELTVKC